MFYDHITIVYSYDFYRYRTGWPPPASSPLLYSTNYCSDMQLLAWPSSLPLSPPFCPAYCACALTFFFLCFGSLPRRRSLKGAGDCGYSFLSRGVPSLSGLSGHLEALRCSWGYQAFGSAPLALVVVFVCYLDLTRFLAQLCQKEAALQCLQ